MTEAQEIYDGEPKTVRELMLKHLVVNGLSVPQAEEVLAQFAASDPGEPMLGRWQDAHGGYPGPRLAILKMGINREAVKFIDEAKPKHWARPMFATEEPTHD